MDGKQTPNYPPAGNPDDATLAGQALRDPLAFAELFDRYAQAVYRYLASRLGDPQASQNLMAQTFLAAQETLPRYSRSESFAAWLFSIARRELAGYLDVGGRFIPVVPPAGGLLSEAGQSLRSLINSLGEGEQELLRLRYAAELGWNELATLLGRSQDAVKISLARLMLRLQKGVKPGRVTSSGELRRFENEVRAAVRGADADPAFVARLRRQLLAAPLPAEPARVPERPVRTYPPRPAAPAPLPLAPPPAARSDVTWALGLLALGMFLTLLFAVIIGPRRIWAEALDLFGIGEQVSRSDTTSGQREVLLPAGLERDGVRVTVEQGVAESFQTVLVYNVDGIPAEGRTANESEAACSGAPALELPDGRRLAQNSSDGTGWPTGYRMRAFFPPVPAEVNNLNLILDCLDDTRPGAAPENWVISLRLKPAPSGTTIFWDPALPTVAPTQAGQPAPEDVPASQADGVRFTVEQVSEQEDGYLLQGTLSWQETAFNTIGFNPYQLELRDAGGQPVQIEPADPDTSGYNPAEKRIPWAARISGKNYTGPLTLTLPSVMGYQELSGVAFEVNLGEAPQPGQTWPIDRVVEAGGQQVRVISAGLTRSADGLYWLDFRLQLDPQRVTDLSLHDPDNHSAQIGGQGGTDAQGNPTIGFSYDYLPVGARRIEVDGIWMPVNGSWTVPITLPGGS